MAQVAGHRLSQPHVPPGERAQERTQRDGAAPALAVSRSLTARRRCGAVEGPAGSLKAGRLEALAIAQPVGKPDKGESAQDAAGQRPPAHWRPGHATRGRAARSRHHDGGERRLIAKISRQDTATTSHPPRNGPMGGAHSAEARPGADGLAAAILPERRLQDGQAPPGASSAAPMPRSTRAAISVPALGAIPLMTDARAHQTTPVCSFALLETAQCDLVPFGYCTALTAGARSALACLGEVGMGPLALPAVAHGRTGMGDAVDRPVHGCIRPGWHPHHRTWILRSREAPHCRRGRSQP